MSTKTILLILVVIIAILVFIFLPRSGSAPEETTSPSPSPSVTVSPSPSASASPTASGSPSTGKSEVKEFTVEGKPFSFNPKEIKVKEGDTIRIIFKNTQGFHDWVIDEFDARTKQLQAGQQETIEFVANKKGTFEYYCSVGTHRQQGMVGKLIVQ